ncbi:hypothetical protein CDD83_1629 [Cordyceps sp. RAO-2017]|nr:hypothetical protein CDD83_1629 [Cordyceps sp. RAO-2017]
MLFSLACGLACAVLAQPGLASDPLAKTKYYYRKGGPDDSNHGYIPRSGKNVNIIQLVAGALKGLGVSPETSAVVGAVGFASSSKPLTLSFDLEDLRRPGFFIEHDCSFSREDREIGNNNDFNRTVWNVALKTFKHKKVTSAFDLGKARAARIADAKRRNPKTAFGPRAAAFGAIEIGMVLSALEAIGPAKTEWVRSLFEDERIPTHLGWKLSPLSDNAAFALARGVASFAADPNLLAHAGDVFLSTPQDIFSTLIGAFNQKGSNGKGKSSSHDIFRKIKEGADKLKKGKQNKGEEAENDKEEGRSAYKGDKDHGDKYKRSQQLPEEFHKLIEGAGFNAAVMEKIRRMARED